ncbi:MAG: hypothetical protein KAY75_04235 [Limnohabitans sp.]|jgi:hypothetical protein|nr:hypothetical protein [Limnohabitans sp.]MBP8021639.1 hypothetical protein [Limnohabitans sp.]
MNKAICIGVLFALFSYQNVFAQEGPAVWRCGNEYTNQPKQGQACTRVPVQADVITTAPRQFRAVPPAPVPMPNPAVIVDVPRIDSAAQRARNLQSQHILNEELRKQQRRCQQLPTNSTELVRCQADEAALRRELARLP